MRELEAVSHTLTLSDYVPDEQEEKLEILADLGYLMDAPPKSVEAPVQINLERQIKSLKQLRDYLSQPWLDQEGSSLRKSVRFWST